RTVRLVIGAHPPERCLDFQAGGQKLARAERRLDLHGAVEKARLRRPDGLRLPHRRALLHRDAVPLRQRTHGFSERIGPMAHVAAEADVRSNRLAHVGANILYSSRPMLVALLSAAVAGLASGLGPLPLLATRTIPRRLYDAILGVGAGLMLSAATLG